MKTKNDCERDYIKEAFDKLYNRVMPFVDLTQFSNADTAFKELDKKVHSEIYILKKCLAESDRAVDAGLTRSKVLQERIHELEGENASLRATTFDAIDEKEKEINDLKKKIQYLETENASLRETPFDTLEALKKENSALRTHNEALSAVCESHLKALSEAKADVTRYKKSFMVHHEENDRLRGVVDTLEKEINTLKKKIHDLEEEVDIRNEDIEALIEENADNATRIESLKKANSALRRDNEILWSKIEEVDITTRPWHGDANARTHHKSLVETIEELKAEKARLEEKIDLSYGHEFEFGDEVFVSWSDEPYMYFSTSLLYNPRTERLVYVGKDQHLKWFGEKFSIV